MDRATISGIMRTFPRHEGFVSFEAPGDSTEGRHKRKLSKIRKDAHGEKLRAEIVQIVRSRVEEL